MEESVSEAEEVAGCGAREGEQAQLDFLLPAADRSATAAHALRHAYEQTSIVLGALGPDAVAVGAATLPVGQLLEQGRVVKRLGVTGN